MLIRSSGTHGPATFDFGKPEDTLTVGEGDGAMTYKFEKAVQLDDNDTEIPLAFTDNGTTTVNVYNNIQVVRVYYVTEKPETPESSAMAWHGDCKVHQWRSRTRRKGI